MQDLNGLGDNTEDFIDFSHQDGSRKDRHTQGIREYNRNNDSNHKAEHQASHPKIHKLK